MTARIHIASRCYQTAALHAARTECRRYGTLRVIGPDRRGIVAACSDLLHQHGCSIVSSEHYTDREHGMFYQRIAFQEPDETVNTAAAEADFARVTQALGVNGDLDWRKRRKRVAIFVSRWDHCLWELLLRHQARDLDCDIPIVLSNHKDAQLAARTFGIPYHVFSVNAENKRDLERQQLDLLKQQEIDVIVLARYMQVLSDNFLSVYPNKIINIHHSFLPAFVGGKAYLQAHARGVKLIGATAHYTTPLLDQGPILTQDVVAVSHRDEVIDFVRKGRWLERTCLVRAVQAHLENRVLVYNNKCVVFAD